MREAEEESVPIDRVSFFALNTHDGARKRGAAVRNRPATTRASITHHFEIGAKDSTVDGYITVGLYADGRPAEIFLTLAKTGEAVRGFARCWAICFSICLQYGAPLEDLTERFKYFRFQPSGWVKQGEIRQAHSIPDYVCRWLEVTFCREDGVSQQSDETTVT